LLNVDVRLGRGFKERNAILIGELLALTLIDCAKVGEVALVADENHIDRLLCVLHDTLDPGSHTEEGLFARDVVDKRDAMRTTVVVVSDCTEALLSCSVPDLNLDLAAVHIDRFESEIDADSGHVLQGEVVLGVAQ